MDDLRRAQIEKLVDHFEDRAITQKEIDEFCKNHSIEPVVVRGDLLDYREQVQLDRIVAKLFPKILLESTKLKYVPEFASEKVRKNIEKENDEVRINITKLIEDEGIKYRFVSHVTEELGGLVGNTISQAGTTAFNKAISVMLHLAEKHFGGEYTMKHAKEYAETEIAKSFKEKEEKKDESSE